MQGNGLVLNSVSIKDGRHSWVLPITKTKKKKKKESVLKVKMAVTLKFFSLY
jgi:hypothetical protein